MIKQLEITDKSFKVISDRRTVDDEELFTASGDYTVLSTGQIFFSIHATLRYQDEMIDTIEKLHEFLNYMEDTINSAE